VTVRHVRVGDDRDGGERGAELRGPGRQLLHHPQLRGRGPAAGQQAGEEGLAHLPAADDLELRHRHGQRRYGPKVLGREATPPDFPDRWITPRPKLGHGRSKYLEKQWGTRLSP